jgi:DNA (cytosine-5)-methyltransferase 1
MMSVHAAIVYCMTRALTVADMYCGAGGLSEGLQQVGFEVVFGIDKDPDSCESFTRNHPGVDLECSNITSLTPGDIAKRVGGYVDLVVGGPSCQGFSTAGRRNGWVRDDDDRNDLWSHMLAVVEKIRPRAFMMENVPGLFAWKEGQFGWKIIKAFEALGYGVRHDILLAADYGAPQLRRRLFIVGIRDKGIFRFPEPTHLGGWRRDSLNQWEELRVKRNLLRHVSCWEAIADLPRLDGAARSAAMYASAAGTQIAVHLRSGAGGELRDHEALELSEETLNLVRQVPQGGTWRDISFADLPERFRGMRRTDSTNLFGRLDPARPAYTINTQYMNVTTGCYTHPFEDRALSVREGARLQTFPDRYQFVGSITSRARQIGNAVPPLMGAVLGVAIAQQIGEGNRVRPPAVIIPASTRPARRALTATTTRTVKRKKSHVKPEFALRKALHARGLRYLTGRKPDESVRRSADVVFPRAKVAVFLNSCFWHGCELHARDTKSNTLWWREKIDTNKVSDLETTKLLEDSGWTVIYVWEHEPTEEAADRIETAIRGTQ